VGPPGARRARRIAAAVVGPSGHADAVAELEPGLVASRQHFAAAGTDPAVAAEGAAALAPDREAAAAAEPPVGLRQRLELEKTAGGDQPAPDACGERAPAPLA